jgi:hypothetical protein
LFESESRLKESEERERARADKLQTKLEDEQLRVADFVQQLRTLKEKGKFFF